jgi:hypothetical protein
MKNKTLVFVASFLIVFSALFGISMPTVEAEEGGSFEQQKITSHLLINLFLEKIDHGELVIFEHTITKSDLQPHQVSYIHSMADDSLLVRLCFKLQKKIKVPRVEDIYIDRITVETDKSGQILQVITHVSLPEEERSK